MSDLHLVDLTNAEVDEISGGNPWLIVAGGIFLGGLVVEAYNAYKDEQKEAAKELKKKAPAAPKV